MRLLCMKFVVLSKPADSKLAVGDVLTRVQFESVCEIPLSVIPDHRRRIAMASEFTSNNGYRFEVRPERGDEIWPDSPLANELYPP